MRIHDLCLLLIASATITTPALAQAPARTPPPALVIPRLAAPPDLAAFVAMQPSDQSPHGMARVDRFTQRWPSDGQPERMPTVAYLGYTDEGLHVVFQAFDPDPPALRAHLMRREDVFAVNDDAVELRLDTFGDHQQSYYFVANPLGVQLDASWPEVGGQYDESFDAVWHTTGQRTDRGFVVIMTIPFKSLRFPPGDQQSWGFYLGRWIPRTGEWSFWPRISDREQSFLAQMARLEGVRGVSRGRGVQLVPYGSTRAFTSADTRRGVVRDRLDPRAGLDAKLLLSNALVLDVAANPDFSQVESDAPQVTTNQRFEVFFPEKRPFFLENAGFMQTPVNLFFTRRLADPNLGIKLTGKVGPWQIGALAADDDAPGARVAESDAAFGSRAWAGVVRGRRSLFSQSSVGVFTSLRTFAGRENTVAGVDGRFRFARVWTLDSQLARSVVSGTTEPSRSGSAYTVTLARNGRTINSRTQVDGRSPGFVSDLGFVPRVDLHQVTQVLGYTRRPAKALNDWGPRLTVERIWAHDGRALDVRVQPSLSFNFKRATTASVSIDESTTTLRPGDAPNLPAPLALRTGTRTVNVSSSPRPYFSASARVSRGDAINFAPAGTLAPFAGAQASIRASLGLRPLTPLRIDNTWLRTALRTRLGDQAVFTTTIVRSQWAWQFTREWSLRMIGQFDDTRANPALTTVAARRNVNVDVLLTRLINPSSAIYAGYNGNAQNRVLIEQAERGFRFAPSDAVVRDSWQVFVKWSHLLRW